MNVLVVKTVVVLAEHIDLVTVITIKSPADPEFEAVIVALVGNDVYAVLGDIDGVNVGAGGSSVKLFAGVCILDVGGPGREGDVDMTAGVLADIEALTEGRTLLRLGSWVGVSKHFQ